MSYPNLTELAGYFRTVLATKKYILLFAYNGIGKTRLSGDFKTLGQNSNIETREKSPDTLYYNAFTEDLFSWDNDTEGDASRKLNLHESSNFFAGLEDLDMNNKIRSLLHRYADFNFTIYYDTREVIFFRDVLIPSPTEADENAQRLERFDNIKISRGEENIFIWCFFLAIVELAMDKHSSYSWVKYIYIDDPISSLDDNNAIAVACHLAEILKRSDEIKVVISSHHTLFFNVLYNEFKKEKGYNFFLSKDKDTGYYTIRDTGDTPFFHHVALLKELKKASDSGELYTYHFNILRNILEKTASFHGFSNFSRCVWDDPNDPEKIVHTRMVNILSHGNYSLFDLTVIGDENKEHFKKILDNFLENYNFNITEGQ